MADLPFESVKSLCATNKKLHDICTNDKYNGYWNKNIMDTYGHIKYYKSLIALLDDNKSNYILYTELINKLDPSDQIDIYMKKGYAIHMLDLGLQLEYHRINNDQASYKYVHNTLKNKLNEAAERCDTEEVYKLLKSFGENLTDDVVHEARISTPGYDWVTDCELLLSGAELEMFNIDRRKKYGIKNRRQEQNIIDAYKDPEKFRQKWREEGTSEKVIEKRIKFINKYVREHGILDGRSEIDVYYGRI